MTQNNWFLKGSQKYDVYFFDEIIKHMSTD